MDEINRKCKNAIDHQNTFFLSYIPGLDILISRENPLYIEEIFPKYKYMNLLQYSVAAKKPKSLKFLLNFALKECKNMTVKKLIMPTQTPPRDMNLIALAIEFQSNSCLEVLANFILSKCKDEKFDFDIEDQFGETPLIKAIRDKNNEAVLILINQCHADIMHRANEEKSTLRPLLPILIFFLNYTNIHEMESLWSKINEKSRLDAIDKLNKLKFDENFHIVDENNDDAIGKKLKDILEKKNLNYAFEFYIGQLNFKGEESIPVVVDLSRSSPQRNEEVSLRACIICGTNNDITCCNYCQNCFCQEHFVCHNCTTS